MPPHAVLVLHSLFLEHPIEIGVMSMTPTCTPVTDVKCTALLDAILVHDQPAKCSRLGHRMDTESALLQHSKSGNAAMSHGSVALRPNKTGRHPLSHVLLPASVLCMHVAGT